MKLIDLHKEWCKEGWLPDSGLCISVPELFREAVDLFKPSVNQRVKMVHSGYAAAFWGHGAIGGDVCDDSMKKERLYNSFRQSVVLLICAMNNEL